MELAIVRTAPDGTVEDSWSTLLNPQRDLGPTHVHGIRGADVRTAQRLARAAGMVVRERVTKALDALVVADANSLSAKAAKARSYGTRIMAEAAFWHAVGAIFD